MFAVNIQYIHFYCTGSTRARSYPYKLYLKGSFTNLKATRVLESDLIYKISKARYYNIVFQNYKLRTPVILFFEGHDSEN